MLGEAHLVQDAGAEIAVDHAHRRIAKHECENAFVADRRETFRAGGRLGAMAPAP